jgi:hypothetical protein
MTAPVMGLFHRETLMRTRLIGSFVGADYVLLLEAGLLGKIVQLDGEPLFQRRIHEEMSRKARVSERDVLDWFDPTASVKLSPKNKLYLEYLRAPMRLDDLSWTEKTSSLAAIVGGVSFRRARVLVGRYRRRLFVRPSATGS